MAALTDSSRDGSEQDPGAHGGGHVLGGHGSLDNHHWSLDGTAYTDAGEDLQSKLCGESGGRGEK